MPNGAIYLNEQLRFKQRLWLAGLTALPRYVFMSTPEGGVLQIRVRQKGTTLRRQPVGCIA